MQLARAMTALTLKLAGPSRNDDLAPSSNRCSRGSSKHHVLHGACLAAAELCGPRAELVEPLRALIDRYQSITVALERGLSAPGDSQTGRGAGRRAAGVRRVSDHRTARRRRHGRGLQAAGSDARSHRRRQDHPPRSGSAGGHRRVPARGPVDGAVLRSAHRPHLRVPARRRSARHHHGARRRVRARTDRAVARVRAARPRAHRDLRRRSITRTRSASSTAT